MRYLIILSLAGHLISGFLINYLLNRSDERLIKITEMTGTLAAQGVEITKLNQLNAKYLQLNKRINDLNGELFELSTADKANSDYLGATIPVGVRDYINAASPGGVRVGAGDSD